MGIESVAMRIGDYVVVHAVCNESRPTPVIVDTGSMQGLVISESSVPQLGVRAGLEEQEIELRTNLGSVHARRAGHVRVTLGRTVVSVPADIVQPRHLPVLGAEALRQFGGVIFDWPSGRLWLIDRGSRPETGFPWIELPLLRFTLDDPARDPAPTFRPNALLVHATLAGDPVVCLLDTGFPGELLCHDELRGEGSSRPVTAETLGLRLAGELAHSPGVLRFGHLEFNDLTVLRVPSNSSQARLYSVVVGLSVLRTYPMWVDYDNGVVRFWTSNDPLDLSRPAPSVSSSAL